MERRRVVVLCILRGAKIRLRLGENMVLSTVNGFITFTLRGFVCPRNSDVKF